MAENGSYAPGFGVPPMGYVPSPQGDPRVLSLQRGLLYAMLPLHLIMGITQGTGFVSTAYMLFATPGATSMTSAGYYAGQLLINGLLLVWAIGGGIWAIKLSRGLKYPSPRLEASLKNYWRFSALSCLCFPLGIIGLINASRPDVREALSGLPNHLTGR